MSIPVLDHIEVIEMLCSEYRKVNSLPENNRAIKEVKKDYLALLLKKIKEQIAQIEIYI